MYLPGKYSLILSVNTNFKKPVFINDKLTIEGIVIKKISFGKIIVLKTQIKNQKKEIVVNGNMTIKLLK